MPKAESKATPGSAGQPETGARKERESTANRKEELFGQNRQRLLAYFISCGISRDRADDLLQMVWIKLQNARLDESRGNNHRPLLGTMAKQVIVDEVRKANAQMRSAEEVGLYDREGDELPLADKQATNPEMAACIKQALECLSDDEREAVLLTCGKFTQREIAEEMKISRSTVKRLLTGAAKKVRPFFPALKD